MPTVIVTGSGGLIGSETVAHFVGAGYDVVGIENDMRARLFGPEASTAPTTSRLQREFRAEFSSVDLDIRDSEVQEYGRYFQIPTVCFRGGCLTGPSHQGALLHGFLAYLMKCTVIGQRYTVFGFEGKQVRDNIHSGDVVSAFEGFHRAPRNGAVYNLGGGRASSCSMLEAIAMCERIADRQLDWTLSDDARIGDHRWWISDLSDFASDYPSWELRYDLETTLREIHDYNVEAWAAYVP